ncbi:MAG: twin-arginine translocase TatA/TatE family subunit [Alphaproteobacteria bacterium]
MGAFSLWQWLVVLAVVLILFARPGKISGIMGDFGKGLKNFKKGMKDGDASDEAASVSDEAADAVYIEEADEPAPIKSAVRAKKTTAKKSATKKKTSRTVAAKKTAQKKAAKK